MSRFLSLKARTAFAAGLFCRKIVARVSLPFCSCIIYTSIRICALCSAVCLSQQSSGYSCGLCRCRVRHAMLLLEWLFLNNNSGSLVNAATNLSPWRRLLTPALGGLAAGIVADGLAEIYPATPCMRRPITWKRCKPMVSLVTQQAWLNRLPLYW